MFSKRMKINVPADGYEKIRLYFCRNIFHFVDRFVIILFFSLLITACQSSGRQCSNERKELIAVAEDAAYMRCELIAVNDEVTQLWDNYNGILESSFAPTTNDFIRGKMLEMRNGELLRMFQSFDSLEMKAKISLEETEKRDKQLAESMEGIQQALDDLEAIRMSVLLSIEEQCPDKLEEYRNVYQITLKRNCDALQ